MLIKFIVWNNLFASLNICSIQGLRQCLWSFRVNSSAKRLQNQLGGRLSKSMILCTVVYCVATFDKYKRSVHLYTRVTSTLLLFKTTTSLENISNHSRNRRFPEWCHQLALFHIRGIGQFLRFETLETSGTSDKDHKSRSAASSKNVIEHIGKTISQ